MSSRYAKKRKHELDSDTSDKKHSSEHRHRETKNADSMSIEETNKMRASLGLAPLEIDDGPKIRESESGDPKEKIVTEDGMEFVHKPSENLAQKKKTEKIKEKLELQKQKRIVQSKLKSKGLADTSSDEEENAETWVEKQRRLAEQKAKELEQMDEDAEKSAAPVIKKVRKPGALSNAGKDTSGMIVGHSKDTFLTGEEQILVLDDKSVLDEDGEEVLINPTLMYSEQLQKNRKIREKKSGYNPYDEEEVDEFGVVKRKDLLSKYDEGIDGPQARETFKLDEHGGVDVNREAEELQQKRNLFMANRKLQTLETPKYKIASEFYTEEEMISFRKPKKKKDGTKSRKRKGLKVDELIPEPEQETLEEQKAREDRLKARRRANGEITTESNGNGTTTTGETKMEIDKEEGEIEDEVPVIKKERFRNTMGATIDKTKMHSLLSKLKKREEEDEEEEDNFESMDNLAGVVIDDEVEDELSAALEKARRLREVEAQKNKNDTTDSGAQVKAMLSKIKKEEEDEMEVDDDNNEGSKQIIFDSTSEYYKTIGNIPTIGLAGNRDDDVDYSEVLAEQAKELAEKEERVKRRKQENDDSDEEKRRHKKDKKRSHREKDREQRGDERKDKDGRKEKDDRKHRSPEEGERTKDDDEKNSKDKYENVLGKEADVTRGVAGMLKLAGEKGYLEDPNAKRLRGGTLKHLESKLVAKVEFSKYDIDDKHLKKLERMGTTGSGPLRSFPEKRDYVPNVEIAYTDAQGRDMDQKAAFRQLSHKFHGKAPGKKQIEKRMRQQDKKEKLKKMNSSDTPLGTLSKQIKKQEQLQSHFLVLSGGRSGGDPNAPLQKD
uniref:U4/U6.U5 tri-snRNP-associated protein 1 n=1 Tax=Panagrolaimus davidi TaxID=227884 RepID=A0A914PF89_9BILA